MHADWLFNIEEKKYLAVSAPQSHTHFDNFLSGFFSIVSSIPTNHQSTARQLFSHCRQGTLHKSFSIMHWHANIGHFPDWKKQKQTTVLKFITPTKDRLAHSHYNRVFYSYFTCLCLFVYLFILFLFIYFILFLRNVKGIQFLWNHWMINVFFYSVWNYKHVIIYLFFSLSEIIWYIHPGNRKVLRNYVSPDFLTSRETSKVKCLEVSP